MPVPEGEGGETAFLSMRHAWNTLPLAEQSAARSLVAVHDLTYSRALAHPDLRGSEDVPAERPPVSHPVVRHTASGATLFLGAHASHLLGAPNPTARQVEESRETICRLNRHICLVDDSCVITHQWKPSDLVSPPRHCSFLSIFSDALGGRAVQTSGGIR
eukprot:COSAG04_NODE_6896_length_1233_cov_0.910935_2_plen_160_part_00